MSEKGGQGRDDADKSRAHGRVEPPHIALPKDGGAIRLQLMLLPFPNSVRRSQEIVERFSVRVHRILSLGRGLAR